MPTSHQISVLPYSRRFGESDVAALEHEAGRPLPADIRDFLLAYGSGLPRPKWFCAISASGIPQWWMVTSLAVPEFGQPIPGYLTIGQIWPAGAKTSDCLLLLRVADDGFGVWSCRDKANDERPAPEPMAASFTELLRGLCYPPESLPWMKLIDEADVAGFRRWLAAGADFLRRDPVSEYTPIEYAAGAHDPTVMLGDLDDQPLRRAAFTIVQLLLTAGAEPGRALRHAFYARNLAIVELLAAGGLEGLPPGDLADMRYSLRHRPSYANPDLQTALEREIRRRKHEYKASR